MTLGEQDQGARVCRCGRRALVRLGGEDLCRECFRVEDAKDEAEEHGVTLPPPDLCLDLL